MDNSLVNAVPNCGPISVGPIDKSKEWQMEMLMEKLRSKSGQFKSFFESAKALRMSLLEKRYQVDSMERNQLYKCLDTIQQNINVTSLQAMVERLESVSRQLGLKFMAGPSGLDWFISSDMFYLEVVFESDDTVKDVKIHHEGKVEQQSCEELVACLTRRDFADFTAQLEGLASIYQLNAEKKIKCKAFSALASLEADLATLASLQTIIKEPFNLVHKSPVGVLQRRRGGHPMKLTYFVSPYDLLDPVNKCSKPLVVENLDVGNNVTVCIEGSLSHKLQISTLITVNSNSKNLVPVYSPLTNQNSTNLPACFVLRLSKPMPICVQLVRKIEQTTEIECGDVSSAVPLLSLIVQHANLTTSGNFDQIDNKGLFVVLPDQVHCYFMTENRQLDGIVVTNIPFTHPAHVPQILVYLRQQALLNTIITSCVRPNSSKQIDLEKVIMMEVTPLSYQQVSISLEHPTEESMATAELDLSDITNIICKTYNALNDNHCNDYGTRVLQRSMSIPVTMRALIRGWQREASRGQRVDVNGISGGSNGSGSGGSAGGNSGGGNSLGGTGPSGGSAGGGSTDHEINIKPDPDMMPNDCNQMVTDSVESTTSDRQSVSTDASNLYSNVSLDIPPSVMESSVGVRLGDDVKRSNSPQDNDNVPDDTVFNILANEEKQMNLNLLSASSISSTATNVNDNSNDNVMSDGSTTNSKKRKWKQMNIENNDNECEIILETSSSNDSVSNLSSANNSNNSNNNNNSMNKDDVEVINEPDTKVAKKSNSSSCSSSSFAPATTTASSSTVQSQQLPSSILLDLENKNLVPPSVSITPIPSSGSGNGSGLDRRSSIEIIPITSSITITPIAANKDASGSSNSGSSNSSSSNNNSSNSGNSKDSSGNSRKSSSSSKSSSNEDKDRKRKRRKDDSGSSASSGMGPPSKQQQQDPLLKPVSVSIKPTTVIDCGSPRPSSPSSASVRTPVKSMKHSPSPVSYSSPKSSPKHSTSSPGTGKPSMNALKSAVNSPKSESSSKTSSKSSSSKEFSSRDKDRKSSSSTSGSGHVSPKLKSSVKLKQLDLTSSEFSASSSTSTVQSGSSTPPSGDSKSQPQPRNRKGSLSAVIDKLKSAQHCTDVVGGAQSSDSNSSNKSSNCGNSNSSNCGSNNSNSSSNNNNNNNSSKDRNISSTSKSLSSADKNLANMKATGDSKVPGSSEYILKHSSDGMKITINKTRTKDSSKSTSKTSSGSGSPKTHTGLKPGVNSGPASKKPQQNAPSSKSGGSSNSKTSSNSKSVKVSSPLSSTNKSNKSSVSTSKDKQRNTVKSSSPSSSSMSSSIFKSESRKSSPNAYRDRSERGDKDKMDDFGSKLSASDMTSGVVVPPHLIVEGISKPFDTSFQIPKLSARNNNNNINDIEYNNKKNNNNNDNSTTKNNNNNNTISASNPAIINTIDLTTNNNKQLDNKNNLNLSVGKMCDDIQVIDTSKTSLLNVESCSQSTVLLSDIASTLTGNANRNSNKDSIITLDGATDSVNNNSTILSVQSGSSNVTGLTNAINTILDGASIDLKKISTAITTPQEAAEILLDISASLPSMKVNDKHLSGLVTSVASSLPLRKNTTPPPPPLPPPPLPPPAFPASPSVQVHIVKSPAPSPLIIPSPHSASPCITDDELMDEALVGIGK